MAPHHSRGPAGPPGLLRAAAQAEEMPMMKATKSSAETTATTRVSTPAIRARPTTISTAGSTWPTVGTIASGRMR